MSLGPLDFDRVARKMRNPVGKASLPGIQLGRIHSLGKIENRRLKMRICGAERDAVGSAAAAHVQELVATLEIEPLGQMPSGPERTGVLRGTEPLATDSGVIDHAFIKSFVRENPLAAQSRAEMAETLVAELAVHASDVIAEIAGRAGDEIARRSRRIDKAPVRLADEPKRFERGQQRNQPVFSNTRDRCERGGRGGALSNMGEEIELERGE